MTPREIALAVRYRVRAKMGALKRLVHAPKLPERSDGRRLIHLGCGQVDARGFINVDLLPRPHVHVLTSIDDLGVFPDGYAELVYASHCLEHFSYRRVPFVLKEWARVLRPGGILRVAVPDFAVLVRAYQAGVPLTELGGYLLGEQNYDLNTHLAVFDEPTLRLRLEEAGLTSVRKWSPESANDHDFTDDSSHRLRSGTFEELLSLNLEGEKPYSSQEPR